MNIAIAASVLVLVYLLSRVRIRGLLVFILGYYFGRSRRAPSRKGTLGKRPPMLVSMSQGYLFGSGSGIDRHRNRR